MYLHVVNFHGKLVGEHTIHWVFLPYASVDAQNSTNCRLVGTSSTKHASGRVRFFGKSRWDPTSLKELNPFGGVKPVSHGGWLKKYLPNVEIVLAGF